MRHSKNLCVRWVKGHSGNWGNDLADKKAGRGSDPAERVNWWKRSFQLGSWDERNFYLRLAGSRSDSIAPQVDSFFRNTPNPPSQRNSVFENSNQLCPPGERPPDEYDGQHRLDTYGREVPSLGAITRAISGAGAKCGRGLLKTPPSLPDGDHMLVQLQELRRVRRLENNPVQRQCLSLQICKLVRQVRRRTTSLRCQQAVDK